jgi:gluconolactonase
VVESVPTQFEVIDERFERVGGDARLERLYDGCRWAEGPAYFPAGRYLTWSDIPNDRMLRWDETTGAVGVFRSPAAYPNGHTVDPQGRLVSCEQGDRRVTRTEHDGSVTVLVDRWDGRRFNSPNDVVVRHDGTVWFTDPSYGIQSDYEGFEAEPEINGCHVYRFDPRDGRCTRVTDDLQRPNGLAFSLDSRQLYVVDTMGGHIRRFEVASAGELTGGDVFAESTAGGLDGLRLDNRGRIWVATAEGLHCFDPDGTLIGKLLVPEETANLVFGGPKRNRLFITATTSVYSIMTNVTGAPHAATAAVG